MSEYEEFEGALGLAAFLSDLREELAEASRRAEHQSLKLGVEEVTVELDVAVTLAKRGEATVRRTAWWISRIPRGSNPVGQSRPCLAMEEHEEPRLPTQVLFASALAGIRVCATKREAEWLRSRGNGRARCFGPSLRSCLGNRTASQPVR